jgi:uncharacterized membrane protein
MTPLVIGLILFLGVHLFSYFRKERAALIARWGEGPYNGIYSLISAIGLGLIIWGYFQTRAGPAAAEIVYWPPAWARHVTMFLVLLAMVCFAIYLHRGRLKLWLRNPMSIGVALWAGGHLLSNGKLASVILFGAFLVIALFDIAVNTARGYVPSFIPNPRHDVISIIAGLVLYAFFLLIFHPYVLNLPIV